MFKATRSTEHPLSFSTLFRNMVISRLPSAVQFSGIKIYEWKCESNVIHWDLFTHIKCISTSLFLNVIKIVTSFFSTVLILQSEESHSSRGNGHRTLEYEYPEQFLGASRHIFLKKFHTALMPPWLVSLSTSWMCVMNTCIVHAFNDRR